MSPSIFAEGAETLAIARRKAGRLFAIAFLLLALPAAILQALAPVTAPGRLPEPGLWLLAAPAMLAASLVGALAICRLALRPGEGVGMAFRAAFGRFVPLLGAALLLGVAALLMMGAAALAAVAIASFLPLLGGLALLAFFWIRLILLTPAAAIEPLGPIALIRRAWALSAGYFWRLSGLLLAMALISLAGLMAAGAVGGIAAGLAPGQPQPNLLVLLLVLLVFAALQAIVSALFTVFVAVFYARQAAESLPAGS